MAVIPTLFGDELLQSLGAVDAGGLSAEALARRTLREGLVRLSVSRLCVTLPWGSPLIARFLAYGPLTLMSAWTPAHDEARSVTFSLASDAPPVAMDGAEIRIDPADDVALVALQREIEAGARAQIRARHDADGHLLVARIG
jgi:hypothetical protein